MKLPVSDHLTSRVVACGKFHCIHGFQLIKTSWTATRHVQRLTPNLFVCFLCFHQLQTGVDTRYLRTTTLPPSLKLEKNRKLRKKENQNMHALHVNKKRENLVIGNFSYLVAKAWKHFHDNLIIFGSVLVPGDPPVIEKAVATTSEKISVIWKVRAAWNKR